MIVADLTWGPHPKRPDLGEYAMMDLGGGWEATFIRGRFSIHMAPRHPEIIEMAIWRPDGGQEGGNHQGTETELQVILDAWRKS